MEKTLVIALHGFLGLPADWEAWFAKYSSHSSHQLWAINLWTHPQLNSSLSWSEWITAFLQEVEIKIKQGSKIELWGYSMGGRLALGALIAAPHLFQKGVILSANPGLENDEARQERLNKDVIWSKKFLHQEWTSLMKEWNQQPVLQSNTTINLEADKGEINNPSLTSLELTKSIVAPSKTHQSTTHPLEINKFTTVSSHMNQSFDRQELDYNRIYLSQALDHWSVARQPNYWPALTHLNLPIEWHVGAIDPTYVAIAKRVQKINAHINLHIHPHQGHRLLNFFK